MKIRLAFFVAAVCAAVAVVPAQAAPDSEKEGEEAGPIFVEVPPVSVPLVRGPYLHGRVFVRLSLGVDSQQAQAAVEKQLPRLESAYLDRMSALAQYHIAPDRAVEVPLVARALQQATDKILEPGMAEVLIQETAVRR